MSHAADARRLLRSCRSGALATLSQRLSGHPFASVVPFMSNYEGSPVLLVSRLAEHTKNIAFDARVSLVTHEPHADVQAAARVTIVGTCRRIDAPIDLRDRYVRLFPEASHLLELDFEFHCITPSAVRHIGGFGSIHWVSMPSFLDAAGIDARLERKWLEHLNNRHRHELGHALVAARGTRARDEAVAIALDRDGIDVANGADAYRLPFPVPAASPDELRDAINDLLGLSDA